MADVADPRRRPWPTPSAEVARREMRELVALARRVVLAAAVTGIAGGAVVGVFERVVDGEMQHRLLTAPLAVQMAVPGLGLVVSVVALRWLGKGASPATTDEYLKAFHGQEARFDLRAFSGRFVA